MDLKVQQGEVLVLEDQVLLQVGQEVDQERDQAVKQKAGQEVDLEEGQEEAAKPI